MACGVPQQIGQDSWILVREYVLSRLEAWLSMLAPPRALASLGTTTRSKAERCGAVGVGAASLWAATRARNRIWDTLTHAELRSIIYLGFYYSSSAAERRRGDSGPPPALGPEPGRSPKRIPRVGAVLRATAAA